MLPLAIFLATAQAQSLSDGPPDSRGIIEHEDGTWSYDIDITGIPDEVEGALTWSVVEPIRFANPDTPENEETVAYVTDNQDPVLPLEEQLLGMRRYSADGLLWVVTHVDTSLLDPELVEIVDAQVDEWNERAAAGEFDNEEPRPSFVRSWTGTDCNSNGFIDMDIYDLESRNVKTSNFTDRQKRVVRFRAPWDEDDGFPDSGCSGVLLRDRWVLTAAHCAVNENGVIIHSPTVNVVVQPHSTTEHGIIGYYIPPGYNRTPTNNDIADDWMLLHLTNGIPGTGDFDLSDGSDEFFMETPGAAIHDIGYPAYRANYTLPGVCVQNNFSTVDREMYTTNDHIHASTLLRKIKFKGDSSGGNSGGPIFVCTGGNNPLTCEGGDKGIVVAVHSTVTRPFTGSWRLEGPRASSFYSTAMTVMQ